MNPNLYTCPICDSSLTLDESTYRCESNHCFDKAKEGYVNLLPVQHKHSKDPGDNKAMVNARRQFLEAGFYQPLRDKIVELYQTMGSAKYVLDAGCGEGYYTNEHNLAGNEVFGVDIAKNAVRIAAKKYKDCQFSVGSIAKLPFSDGFFGWLYSIYAPIKVEEFHRLLSEQGYLLTVTPGLNHLWQLKELIYQNPKQHNIEKQHLEGFCLLEEQNLTYEMTFTDSAQSINLLAMTPFAFKTSESLVATLTNAEQFICQADFMIRIYKKS